METVGKTVETPAAETPSPIAVGDETPQEELNGGVGTPKPSEAPPTPAPEEAPSFHLEVSPDRMAVLLDCEVAEGGIEPLATAVASQLQGLKITELPEPEALAKLLSENVDDESKIRGLHVVRGKPMVPPKDAEIQWAHDFFAVGFAEDEETGAVDYRQRTADVNVKEGEHLARVLPAIPGEDGHDVFGKRRPTRKPNRPKIRSGSNVSYDEDTASFQSTSVGRIRWLNGMLSVDKIFVVEGSVGLETGNIKHPGALIVGQDILEGSVVEAEGDIEVKGIIEAADVKAGGNLIVHGGISGSEGVAVVVEGSVHAKFILDAHIEAGESVIVEREIVHSTVRSRASVQVIKGRIVGGEITALGGIEVSEGGSDAVVRTLLTAGEDYCFEEKLRPKQTELEQLEERVSQIRTAINPLLSKLDLLPQGKREAIEKLAASSETMDSSITQLHEDIETLKEESDERAKPVVILTQTVYPETVLCLRGEKLIVKNEHDGPLKATYLNGRVRLKPWSKPKKTSAP